MITPTSDDLASMYMVLLSDTLNHLAPLKSRRTSFCYCVPWFTPELCKMKAAGHQLEHVSRKTGLSACVLTYEDQVKDPYVSPAKQFPVAASTKLCCDFMDFHKAKSLKDYHASS